MSIIEWHYCPETISPSLPFLVKLLPRDDDDIHNSQRGNCGLIRIIVLKVEPFMTEGFENQTFGLWKEVNQEHYQHTLDRKCSATNSTCSLRLEGGSETLFAMTLKMTSESQPSRVSFHVRTDTPGKDAGHFILGESNEVNKRVAQFQFNKDGKMGLLGSGGKMFGSVPYEADKWYHVVLYFEWTHKKVSFSIDGITQADNIPFRRESSSFISCCALGNRDNCVTWFDNFEFAQHKQLPNATLELRMQDGMYSGTHPPLNEEGQLILGAQYTADSTSAKHTSWSKRVISKGFDQKAAAENINNCALAEYSSLLNDKDLSDVTFVVEGQHVYCHKAILATRCDKFKCMFCSGMKESMEKEIHLPHPNFEAFFCMLTYIYGGSVNVPQHLAVELLGLADQYMLDGLKYLCGVTLVRHIDTDCVIGYLQALDRHNMGNSDLKTHCINYIVENMAELHANGQMEDDFARDFPHLIMDINRAAAPYATEGSRKRKRLSSGSATS